MKQVHASYSFVASTKTITLTGLNIDQDQLLLIVNATRGVQYFNFADSSLRATVTPGTNTTVVLTDASTTGHANGDALVIYYDDQVTSQVVSGTVTANPGTGAFTVSGTVGLDNASLVALENITVTVGNTVTVALDANSLSALENVTVTVGAAVSVSNFPSTQAIAGTVTANGGNFLNGDNALITRDSASNIVLVGGLKYSATPTQSAINAIRTDGNGAVLVYSSQTNWTDTNAGNQPRSASQQTPFPVQVLGGSVTVGSLPAISGTVTANLPQVEAWAGIYDNGNDCIKIELANLNGDTLSPSNPIPISGTVTANNPSGALTTRFGSVTTANTAQITSAVTNTSRKYLLAQNISAGTVTIGIGFSPTTTQGIQLTAGAGLTFDAFCPTGAVYWLGAVTGAAYTILEG